MVIFKSKNFFKCTNSFKKVNTVIISQVNGETLLIKEERYLTAVGKPVGGEEKEIANTSAPCELLYYLLFTF